MEFERASTIESLTWQLRLADYHRSKNRSRINDLFNGCPPYSMQEEEENEISVNCNFLEATKLGHDARGQFYNAFMKPAQYFTAKTDMGPPHKRDAWSSIVTSEANKVMNRSLPYFESFRSQFALNVLHGIGPAAWSNCESWCPSPHGVEDVLIPSNTLLTMENLPFFAIYRNYTAVELIRAAKCPHADPAWQQDTVDAAVKWVDKEASQLLGTTWPEVWSPEKMSERLKGDSGLYASDAVPTISAWDFYFWNDSKDVQGWNRRIVLDAFGQPGIGGLVEGPPSRMSDKNQIGGRDQFLYNPGKKKYGTKLSEIIHWQFADLSAVAPFRYHSVRSIGFMLYAVCHLQNRLRCKFNEAVFENLMMYLRVRSSDELERALKVNMISRGIIDESVQFVPPAERWQVNEELAQLGLQQNQSVINENSASYVQNQNYSNPSIEKTKFQVQAELSATTQLISTALLQAYRYQEFQYREILRRLFIVNSRDPQSREFQNNCRKKGVPSRAMCQEAWDITTERVMGSGNKALELNIANQLMQWRPLYDPDSQRAILSKATLAVTDDPGFTASVVPPKKTEVSDAAHDAQLAAGALMAGIQVALKKGQLNQIDYTEALLHAMASIVMRVEKAGGMASQSEILGLQTMGGHIAQHIKLIAQDPMEKQRATQYSTDLGNLMNMVKAYGQRLQQQMEKQAKDSQMDPAAMAKIQTDAAAAQQKMKNSAESHQLKAAQRQQQFASDEQRKQQTHAMQMQRDTQGAQLEDATEDARTASEIRNEGVKTRSEIEMERAKATHEIRRENVKTKHDIARKNAAEKAKPKPNAKPTAKT